MEFHHMFTGKSLPVRSGDGWEEHFAGDDQTWPGDGLDRLTQDDFGLAFSVHIGRYQRN